MRIKKLTLFIINIIVCAVYYKYTRMHAYNIRRTYMDHMSQITIFLDWFFSSTRLDYCYYYCFIMVSLLFKFVGLFESAAQKLKRALCNYKKN